MNVTYRPTPRSDRIERKVSCLICYRILVPRIWTTLKCLRRVSLSAACAELKWNDDAYSPTSARSYNIIASRKKIPASDPSSSSSISWPWPLTDTFLTFLEEGGIFMEICKRNRENWFMQRPSSREIRCTRLLVYCAQHRYGAWII